MFDISEDGPTLAACVIVILFAIVFFIGLAMGSATVMALSALVCLATLAGMLIWMAVTEY